MSRPSASSVPRSTQDPGIGQEKYRNIFNFINPIDFVPKMAMRAWDFARYGQDLYFPAAINTGDYLWMKNAMQQTYTDIFTYNDAAAQQQLLLGRHVGETPGQSPLLDDFMDELAATAGSRKRYTRELQEDFMQIAAETLGGGAWEFGALFRGLSEVVSLLYQPITVKVVDMFTTGSASYAHYPELCLAWMDSVDEAWMSGQAVYELEGYEQMLQDFRRYVVNCPVDVAVYDETDTLVARIVDDVPVPMEGGLDAYVDANGQKIVLLPGDAGYRVELTATGSGAMTCSVEVCSPDGQVQQMLAYYDVAIESGDTLQGTAADLTKETADYRLTRGEETLTPSLELHSGDTLTARITTQVQGHGQASATQAHPIGEFVTLYAQPRPEEEFQGWYEGDTLVSEAPDYRFRVEQPRTLTAKFTVKVHNYKCVTTRYPDCDTVGKQNHTCEYCGDVYTTDIDMLGHNWNSGTVTTRPTAYAEGVRTYTCTRSGCGQTRTEPVAMGCPGGTNCPGIIYTDMPALGHWAHAGIEFVTNTKLMNGMGNNLFQPDGEMTRAQLVTILYRDAGSPRITGDTPFVDLQADWYRSAVLWAADAGITTGKSATRFDPDAPVTRQELSAFLQRYAAWSGRPTDARADLTAFPDAGQAAPWAKAPLQWAVAEGLINGVGEKLAPTGTATRAQIATIMLRYKLN